MSWFENHRPDCWMQLNDHAPRSTPPGAEATAAGGASSLPPASSYAASRTPQPPSSCTAEMLSSRCAGLRMPATMACTVSRRNVWPLLQLLEGPLLSGPVVGLAYRVSTTTCTQDTAQPSGYSAYKICLAPIPQAGCDDSPGYCIIHLLVMAHSIALSPAPAHTCCGCRRPSIHLAQAGRGAPAVATAAATVDKHLKSITAQRDRHTRSVITTLTCRASCVWAMTEGLPSAAPNRSANMTMRQPLPSPLGCAVTAWKHKRGHITT
jgi:hypothetical protein